MRTGKCKRYGNDLSMANRALPQVLIPHSYDWWLGYISSNCNYFHWCTILSTGFASLHDAIIALHPHQFSSLKKHTIIQSHTIQYRTQKKQLLFEAIAIVFCIIVEKGREGTRANTNKQHLQPASLDRVGMLPAVEPGLNKPEQTTNKATDKPRHTI